MIEAACHCGAVRIEVARAPRVLTSCNCSICRRYGTLWAYYTPASLRIVCPPSELSSYAWGRKALRFRRCKTCGTVTHYDRPKDPRNRRIGVNANNFDPSVVAAARIRHLDGAATWKYFD
jgi:hypothetical protein